MCPLPKLRLLGIALEHLEVRQEGRLVTSWLREEDFAAAGANDSHAEGIIDTLRQVKGAVVAVAGPREAAGRSAGDQGEPPLDGRPSGRGRYRRAQGRRRAQAGRRLHHRGRRRRGARMDQSANFRACCDARAFLRSVPARVVLLDKPAGPTSFDMVRMARRGMRGRVGHAGTLDPFATGLLLIMTGSATRISSLLMGLPKEYDLLVQFGAVSSTGDPTGVIGPLRRAADARWRPAASAAQAGRGGDRTGCRRPCSTGSEGGSRSGSRSPRP